VLLGMNDLGIRNEKEAEIDTLRKIGVEYFTCGAAWLCCLASEEPDCGIPIKSWVAYYLFFRIFRHVHNIVGILLILNDRAVYYKPIAKFIIFVTFE